MRIQTLVGLSCIVVTLAVAAPLTANQTEVPFVLHRGYTIVVKGAIGSRRGLNFIIDTGAVPSVVDQRISRHLGLAGQADQVSVFTRSIPTERVTLPSVDIGPVHAAHVEALVEDLSFIEARLGVRIDALIGLDVFGSRDFSIDYAASRLRFDAPLDAADVWTDIAAGDGYAVVEMELNGVPLRLMVDTGANHVILFASHVPGLYANARIENEKVSSTIGGAVRLKQMESPIASLGQTPLKVTSVLILDTPENLSLAIDGLLGVAALKPLRVEFSLGRRLIGWKW